MKGRPCGRSIGSRMMNLVRKLIEVYAGTAHVVNTYKNRNFFIHDVHFKTKPNIINWKVDIGHVF